MNRKEIFIIAFLAAISGLMIGLGQGVRLSDADNAEKINTLTKEIRFLENKNHDELKKDLSLLERARDELLECEQMYKGKP